MLKSKNILRSNLFYIIVIIITFIYVFINIQDHSLHSKYGIKSTILVGMIDSIKMDGEVLTLEVIGKERILVKYYLKTKEEKEKISSYILGDTIKLTGVFGIPPTNTNFNLFSYKNYLRSKKISLIFTAETIMPLKKNGKFFYKIKNGIIDKIEKMKTKGYLYTFILGDTQYINNRVNDSYRINGISHLFAISGMHIGLLAGFSLKILLHSTKRRAMSYSLCILFLLFYAYLTGLTPSVMRATLLFVGLSIKKIFHLKITSTHIFILIVCFLLWNCPYYLYHIGFLFSFTISFFLITGSDGIQKRSHYFGKVLYISILSFLASIPILLSNFFELNILSPFLNLFFVPYVSFLLFPLSVLTFFIPIVDSFFNVFIGMLEVFSLWCSQFPLKLIFPKMPLFLSIIYYLVLFKMVRGGFKIKGLFLIVLFFTGYYLVPVLRIHSTLTMIDVGQGDSILLELKNGKNILIDTGGQINFTKESWKQRKNTYHISENTIISYLKSRGIRTIDFLILTHGDMDHMGESLSLIKRFPIKKVFLNSGHDNFLEKKVIMILKQKRISYKKISKQKIWIRKDPFYFINQTNKKNENEDSLILYTRIENHNILFMGDAEKESERYINSVYNLPKMDILKVGHHGSKTGTEELFLEKIRPDYSIISAGENNRYGHPSASVLKKLKKIGSSYYVTSKNGMIRMTLQKKISIYTCL